jgi:putative phosphoesterase
MKIGVISDTHLSKPSKELSRLASGIFADVSLILHAGDLTSMRVLDAFPDKEVIAVCGNMDQYDVAGALQTKRIVAVEKYRIGLIHGWGSLQGIEDRIVENFKDVHAIVYGHTHMSVSHWKDGILMFNPGAFSGSYSMKRNCSVGLLTVNDGITGTIIQI